MRSADVFVKFDSTVRRMLPKISYRPDIVLDKKNEYWGVTFIEFDNLSFDEICIAKIKFTFNDEHYLEIEEDQMFSIMEGATKVGEGIFIQINM